MINYEAENVETPRRCSVRIQSRNKERHIEKTKTQGSLHTSNMNDDLDPIRAFVSSEARRNGEQNVLSANSQRRMLEKG